MLQEKWTVIEGITNMGESNETVAARLIDGGILVAYAAYSGIKVLELQGVVDCCTSEETRVLLEEVVEVAGDDFEVAIPVVIEGNNVILIVDNMDSLTTVGAGNVVVKVMPTVGNSYVYEEDELITAAIEQDELEGLMDAMEL